MAKKTTTWRPDTCGCVLAYEWDDEVPEDKRAHTPVVTELSATCVAHRPHASAGGVKGLHAQVVAENQAKNGAHARLLDRMAYLCDEKVDGDGNVSRELKAQHEMSWSFDKNRKLKVSVRGVSDKDVQAALSD